MRGLVLVCLIVGCSTSARAASSEIPFQPDLSGRTVQCASFRPGPDGTWTTVHAVAIQRENEYTTVAADSSFKAGGPKTVGIDVGAVLDAVCPR